MPGSFKRSGNASAGGLTAMTPTTLYHLALRASQAGNGSPLDQSGKMRDPAINAALFPPARANATAYTVGQYRSPAALNGRLYKCTTAGTSAAAAPAWNATLGGTTADGTVVWTTEQGPWGNSAAGQRHLIAIESASLGANGAIALPATGWDMANNDSLIVRIRQAWDFTNDSRVNLAEFPIVGNRHASANRRGFTVIATGGTSRDLKFGVSDGTAAVLSGHVAVAFGRAPGDGNLRETLFAVDGLQKTAYAWADGTAYSQTDMFSGAEVSPHNRSLAAVTGSTATANAIYVGGAPGGAVTYDFGIIALDIIVLPGRGLPANMQAVADWFWQRGGEALLPMSLVS